MVIFVAAGCGSDNTPTEPSPFVEFSVTDLRAGTGTQAATGSRVSVNYTGWLYSLDAANNKGQQFETTTGRGPFAFTLGAGQVIRGWDIGIAGMRVGGLRRLVIPSDLAYGAAGNGPIPPNTALVFEVELLNVQ